MTPEAPPAARRLLVIDDEANMRHMLTTLLQKAGYQVDSAADGAAGLEKARAADYDFILCDLKMPVMDGMAFLEALQPDRRDVTVIVMSAYGSTDTALEAMKRGAYDYISKPFKPDEVHLALRKAEEREGLKRENLRLKERLQAVGEQLRFGNMIGGSAVMQAVFRLAAKVADYDASVLICGESGTGKELIARGIHFGGRRADKPLVPINCGGIPENLLESELFGHRRGAFTGADRDRQGLFEVAAGGTVFLDEIGEMPVALQVKLLRVLQESEVRPVGAAHTRTVDVRVIAATARRLEDEIRRGGFREDLFYRLNVVTIELPPLRERSEDIPALGMHFVERYNRKLGKRVRHITPAAMNRLMAYPWPGNVRELENVIQRGLLLTEGTQLTPEALPDALTRGVPVGTDGRDPAGFSLKVAQKALEKRFIERALRRTDGNRSQAARLLEISHPSLLSKIKTYGITL